MNKKLRLTISNSMKNEREKRRLTQLEVAEKAGLSVNHYAKIERGEVTPGLDTFEAIIKAIGTTSSKILPF